MIRELTRRPVPSHLPYSMLRDWCAYSMSGGLPWYRETESHPTKEAAWAAADAWAKNYEALDRYGNMAHAHGVIKDGEGWRGVINYFHSNT